MLYQKAEGTSSLLLKMNTFYQDQCLDLLQINTTEDFMSNIFSALAIYEIHVDFIYSECTV